jgi:DegV family protein with EDD domain
MDETTRRRRRMKNVVFVVDSGSDFEFDNELNIQHPVEVVPLNIQIGDAEFLDGVDINKEEFYHKMAASNQLPKTSQPSPQHFYDTFQKYIDEGKTVVSLSIAASLSGTYQSSTIAKEMLTAEEQKNIFLIDTNTVSVAVLLLLKQADEMLVEGNSVENTVEFVEETKNKLKIFALLDTLENLKKGGRISQTQAFIGGLLNIKPIIVVDQGKVDPLGKARGRKKGLQQLSESISKLEKYEKDMLFIAYSFATVEEAKAEVEHVVDVNQFSNTYYYKLGSTIGTHGGVNVLGLGLKER